MIYCYLDRYKGSEEVPQVPNTTPLKPQWFQILLAVADHDLHGLGVMKAVLQQTDGEMRLWPARLYGALKSMAELGLLEEVEGPAGPAAETDRRRFYSITGVGREALATEVRRLEGYVRTAKEKNAVMRSERA